MEQAKELQEFGSSLLWKVSNEEQSLRQNAISFESFIRHIRSMISSLVAQKLLDRSLTSKYEEDLQRAICIIAEGDVAAFFFPAK
ncbi:hypothetical protein like AT1G33230 [Hibiscus trionum]|uniref:Uncharacterized protein n=1 Tax=Hibiscus trionum TaxID=183268 RepID=A0A9W7I432_HIBTR|nr:hypothetical protein like AT1G33230 [Hibiscus trionum]